MINLDLALGLLVNDRFFIANYGLDEDRARSTKEAQEELQSKFPWVSLEQRAYNRVSSILTQKESFMRKSNFILSEEGEMEQPKGGYRQCKKYAKSDNLAEYKDLVLFGYSCLLDDEVGEDFSRLLNASTRASHQGVVSRIKILNKASQGRTQVKDLLGETKIGINQYNNCRTILENLKLINLEEPIVEKSKIATATRNIYSIKQDFPSECRNSEVKKAVYEALQRLNSPSSYTQIKEQIQGVHPKIKPDAIRKALKTLSNTRNKIIQKQGINSLGYVSITEKGMALVEKVVLPFIKFSEEDLTTQRQVSGKAKKFRTNLVNNMNEAMNKAGSVLVG